MNTRTPQPPDGYVMILAGDFREYVRDLLEKGLPGYAHRLMELTLGDWTPRYTNQISGTVSGIVVQAGNITDGLNL